MQRSALCRSQRELSNEYLLAKIGFDTAENEPAKFSQFYRILRRTSARTRSSRSRRPRALEALESPRDVGGVEAALDVPRERREDLSWKVRYRTFPWFFSQMSKLYRARSLLYRRQILQVNIRWKALDEIYKIYTYASFGDLHLCTLLHLWNPIEKPWKALLASVNRAKNTTPEKKPADRSNAARPEGNTAPNWKIS